MKLKPQTLVVDTSGFLRNLPLWEHGEKLVSVDEVFGEIKNRNLQEYVSNFPIAVDFLQPKPQSLKFINEFSKKTGDYHSLSLPDCKILALTYELEVAAKGSNAHLRTEPVKTVTNTMQSVPVEQLDNLSSLSKLPEENEADNEESMEVNKTDDSSSNKNNDEEWNTIKRKRPRIQWTNLNLDKAETVSNATSTASRKTDILPWDLQPGFYLPDEEDQEALLSDCDEEDESQDGWEGGWITPANINQVKSGSAPSSESHHFDEDEGTAEQPLVACMTGDFAMQNVLRHIGLAVLGIDGKVIRDTKTYVLRCFACYTVCSDMSKLFCRKCGNRTLKRVSLTINPDGTQRIWISRKPINTRGMQYNLPRPRGGQHAIMPLLTADQRFPHQWAKRTKAVDALSADYTAGTSPFTSRDLSSRAAQYNLHYGQERGIKGQLQHAKIWKPKRRKMNKK